KIYPVGTEVVLHGHDRCVMMPYRPEWEEDGIVDPHLFDAERAEMIKSTGVPDDPGLSPFEKSKHQHKVQRAYSPAELSDALPLDDRRIRAKLRTGEAALAAGDLDTVRKVINDLAGQSFSPSLQQRYDGLRVSLLEKTGKTPTNTKLSSDDDMRKARQIIRAAEAALVDGDTNKVKAQLAKLKDFGLTASLQARVDAIKQNIGQTVTVKPLPPIKPPPVPVLPTIKPPLPPPTPVRRTLPPLTDFTDQIRVGETDFFVSQDALDHFKRLLGKTPSYVDIASLLTLMPDILDGMEIDLQGDRIVAENVDSLEGSIQELERSITSDDNGRPIIVNEIIKIDEDAT